MSFSDALASLAFELSVTEKYFFQTFEFDAVWDNMDYMMSLFSERPDQ